MNAISEARTSTMPGRVSVKPRPPRAGAERIGDRLSRLRRERGVSQADLGERLGVDQQIVSCYETHRIRIPAEKLLKIADVLKVSVYELLGRAASGRSPKDKNAWKVLEKIESLPSRDRKVVLRTIDALASTARASGT